MKKRKAYRPKPVMQNPLAALRPASKQQRDAIVGRFRSSLLTMTAGRHPGEQEWRDLSDAINTIETMTLGDHPKLIAAEVMPTVSAAIAGMVGAANRFKVGHGMRLDAAGIQALRDIIDVYEQCVEGLTEREMAMAQAETARRVSWLMRHPTPGHLVVAL